MADGSISIPAIRHDESDNFENELRGSKRKGGGLESLSEALEARAERTRGRVEAAISHENAEHEFRRILYDAGEGSALEKRIPAPPKFASIPTASNLSEHSANGRGSDGEMAAE